MGATNRLFCKGKGPICMVTAVAEKAGILPPAYFLGNRNGLGGVTKASRRAVKTSTDATWASF
ncbi:hypothetical protein GCM10010971_38790 [Silvimonas amylolytica]|uniref:Transposase IS66 family protein n=1 Tax=Silvimonas amylolytica TaxID=449663 RepID=A0ABQ2PRH0_9NEIS|nr:hypothetical protein GCM10010971_38790 [Silvimonas amylolytica]